MKAGDLVRFRNSHYPHLSGEWLIGLLVEYQTWEKVGTVFYDGKLWRLRAGDIQKAGKRDEGR
mgnify:CR=1 FL=1